MDIQLSWDLFVMVMFVVIVAYSFIIGRDETLKVILGTYVATLAADSLGNMFGASFSGSPFLLKILGTASVGSEQEAVVFVKVLIFVAMVILFAVRGAFAVETAEDRSVAVKVGLSIIYAILSAGLIINVILVFVSGISFVGGGSPETTTTALWNLSTQSQVIRVLLHHTYLWFCLPALAFLLHSLSSTRE